MADVTENFAAHAMNQLLQIGDIAQGNLVKVVHLLDLTAIHDRAVVSLPEALGAREVGSKEVPAGPNTVATKA